jgi:hypothetical protein
MFAQALGLKVNPEMTTINLKDISGFSSHRALNTLLGYIRIGKYTYCIKLRRIRVTVVAVEKKLRITYSECVFVDLVIMRANRKFSASYLVVICGPSGSTSFHIAS